MVSGESSLDTIFLLLSLMALLVLAVSKLLVLGPPAERRAVAMRPGAEPPGPGPRLDA